MENHHWDRRGTCFIAGCGYVGVRLALRRLNDGPVWTLVRRAAAAEGLICQGIPAIALDLDEEGPGLSPHLPPDLRELIYLAPPSGTGTEDLRLARFLSALGSARPETCVYVSTTGVYGDTGGGPVDEDSPTVPREDRSRQRLDAERRVSRWCLDRTVRCVVLRVPAIYGPYRLPLDRLKRGEPVLRREDSGPGNRIHVDDLVGACLAGLERPVAGVFNLTDGLPESMADFQTRVAVMAGLSAPPLITWAAAQRILSPGLLSFLREPRQITSHRAQELGWVPQYTNPGAGIRVSLTEMGLAIASEDKLSSGAH